MLPDDVLPKQPRVTDVEIRKLETEIGRMNADLPALRSFVLPGGTRLSAELHVCRTVCRRAERNLVELGRREELPGNALEYLNRLSDALFVWSRRVNQVSGAAEVLWDPNAPASGIGAGERADHPADDKARPSAPVDDLLLLLFLLLLQNIFDVDVALGRVDMSGLGQRLAIRRQRPFTLDRDLHSTRIEVRIH